MASRHLARVAFVGFGMWLAGTALGPAFGGRWEVAGILALVFLCVVPLLHAWNMDAVRRFGGTDPKDAPWPMVAAGGGLLVVSVAAAASVPAMVSGSAWVIGTFVLFAWSGILAGRVAKAMPKSSIVDEQRDPLTKGDDACMKQITFAYRFLPVALLMLFIAGLLADVSALWAMRLRVASLHVLGAGFILLSVYAIGHLWVPRFSGVPAIAAGAIKGELHTTLLGIVGLVAGFLSGSAGVTVGLGFFVFVGFFTYMGVLGANIMRRKSQTHRVTPEFVYIPWTFTGVFWLISAVLMGMFLGVVPGALAAQAGGFQNAHIVAALGGGVVQLALGWATRLGEKAPPFAGGMRLSFFVFNAGIACLIVAGFAGAGWTYAGAALAASGVVGFARVMQAFMPRRDSPNV